MDKSFAPLLLLAALTAGPAHAQAVVEPEAANAMRALLAQATQSVQRQGARVEVQLGQPDPRLRLAPCKRTEAYLPTGQRALGRTRVGLRCVEGMTAGTALWNITLPVTVALYAAAPVLREALPAGTKLTAEHFGIAEVDWGAGNTLPLADATALIGRELGRPLPAGSPILAADLRQRQWFAAGETVQVIARGTGFAISTDGEALTHGVEGQPVRVRTGNGRLLSGRATGDRQVEVML